MTTPPRVRVSASSIKALTHCSMAYYYARVMRLPEKVWPRTIVGSLVHSICECLRSPRHRRHYDTIVTAKDVDYARSPALARLVRAWRIKHSIADDLLADLNGMLYVALVLIDFHWVNATKDAAGNPITHGPEHEFDITLDDGTQIKGYIDDMGEMGSVTSADLWRNGLVDVRDFKSQRNRFTANELPNNVQAAVYQLYVKLAFGRRAQVSFVLLRHPPTKRTPEKHLQVVQPASEAHLDGLTEYIKWVSGRVNQFSLEDAYANILDDQGFCSRVCSHYAPHDYWVLVKRDDPEQATIKTFMLENAPKEVAADEVLVKRHHKGCMAKWNG